jgi:hypothetical protein
MSEPAVGQASMSRPECMVADDYAAAEPARQRLVPKRGFRLFASLPNLRQKATPSLKPTVEVGHTDEGNNNNDDVFEGLPSPLESTENTLIKLDNMVVVEDDQLLYRWAILYENQRGCVHFIFHVPLMFFDFFHKSATIFSIPYYSRLSLLPTDPSPFTFPSASDKPPPQPHVTLSSYPLPDGSWRWVSKSWMIDMRSESGEIQHDGFEYNWRFRKGNWRAEPGLLNAGGWVRRRRWVRLMMRPAKSSKHTDEMNANGDMNMGTTFRDHASTNSLPLSSKSPILGISDDIPLSADEVWRGDNVEHDWARCHAAMKCVGRDGRKLELWKSWLEPHIAQCELNKDVKGKGKQTLLPPHCENGDAIASVPIEHITPILRTHVCALISTSHCPVHHSYSYRETTFSACSYTQILAHNSSHSWSVQESCRNRMPNPESTYQSVNWTSGAMQTDLDLILLLVKTLSMEKTKAEILLTMEKGKCM